MLRLLEKPINICLNCKYERGEIRYKSQKVVKSKDEKGKETTRIETEIYDPIMVYRDEVEPVIDYSSTSAINRRQVNEK